MNLNGITIKEVTDAVSEQWDHHWFNCDYATYYQSREWAEIWSEYSKGIFKPRPQLIIFSDGKKAVLPFSVKAGSRGFLKEYYLSPQWYPGGWISADGLEFPHAVLLKNYILHACETIFWRMNPYDPLVLKTGVRYNKSEEIHRISLKEGFDNLCHSWTKKGISREVRCAQRENVTVRLAQDNKDWDAYYEIYLETLKRWGEKKLVEYQKKLFNIMFERCSPNIKLWLAFSDNEVIGGCICFYASKIAFEWHGVSLKEKFRKKPQQMLFYTAVKEACERGCLWFDLGPSPGLEGVRKFKEKLCAKPVEVPLLERRGFINLSVSLTKRILGIK